MASATTLTVAPTDISNLPTNVFSVGDTVILKIEGDAQGAVAPGVFGILDYEAALTTFVSNSQSLQYPTPGRLLHGDGFSYTFNQTAGTGAMPVPPSTDLQHATVVLTADAVGIVHVNWDAVTDLFGSYPPVTYVPTGASFTIVPEPATAALLALGSLGIALGARARRGRS